MSKKVILLVVLITTILIGGLIYLVVLKEPEAKGVKIASDVLSENQTENSSDLVFYELKRPDHLQQSTEDANLNTEIQPCTTDIECQAKNKNISNPYDIILINDANDNIDPNMISERDRKNAEAFSQSLNNSTLSDKNNEIYDMMDALANIQEDIDTHKQQVQNQ